MLSSGIGMAGPAQVMKEAHATGEFLVLENDLNRCIGYGDLTVTATDGRWVRPLLLEIKSGGEMKEGAKMDLNFISVLTNHPLDAELFRRFQTSVGLQNIENPPELQDRAKRQAAELRERLELLVQVTSRSRPVIGPDSHNLWPVIRRVLSRALQSGYAMDVAEDGIVYLAVRNAPLKELRTNVERTKTLATEYGIRAVGTPITGRSTIDFHRLPALSALVPPIALWPLDTELRARLLTNDLVLRCEYPNDLWERVFQSEGMTLTPDHGGWIVSKASEKLRFGRVDVMRLRNGVALAGLSPRALARNLGRELTRATKQA